MKGLADLDLDGAAWVAALSTFGVGDVGTTVVGIALFGAVEASPTVAPLLDAYGFGILVVLKAAVLLGFWYLYSIVPETWKLGVPVGLSLLGSVVVAWNLSVLVALSG